MFKHKEIINKLNVLLKYAAYHDRVFQKRMIQMQELLLKDVKTVHCNLRCVALDITELTTYLKVIIKNKKKTKR